MCVSLYSSQCESRYGVEIVGIAGYLSCILERFWRDEIFGGGDGAQISHSRVFDYGQTVETKGQFCGDGLDACVDFVKRKKWNHSS